MTTTPERFNKAGRYAAVIALAASLTVAPAAFSQPDFSNLSVAFAEDSDNTQTATASDGATVTGLKVIEEGKAIEITGTGWKHPSNGGSMVSVKADKGSVSRDGNGVIAETEAKADGTFKLTIPFPNKANGYNTDWTVGTTHTLHFLSGSMKDGDTVRSPILKLTVADAGTDPSTVVDTSDWTELKAEEATLKIRPYTTGSGSKIRIIGKGWTKQDGKSGSVVALKLGSSSSTYFERSDNSVQNAYLKSLGKSELGDDHTAWVLLTSDASAVNEAAGIYLMNNDGSFDLEIEAPEALQKASAGQYLTVQTLSGRFAEGDTKRSAVSETIPVDGKAYKDESNDTKEKCVTDVSSPTMKITNPTVEAGGKLHLVGSGWCNTDGNGAPRVAIKIDEAKISRLDTSVHSNKTIWAIIDPDETTGEVDYYLQLPKADGSDTNIPLSEGAHSLRLLSGSLEAGDRSVTFGGVGVLDFNIGEYKPNELPDTVSDSDLSDAQQQGVSLTKNGSQVTVTIPSAEPGQWVAVTPYDNGSVRSAWGSGWMQVASDKTITYDLPDGLPAGDYKFAVQSGESDTFGSLLGWAPLTIAADANGNSQNSSSGSGNNSGGSNSSSTNNQSGEQGSGAVVDGNSSASGTNNSGSSRGQSSAHRSVLSPNATYLASSTDTYASSTALGSFSASQAKTNKKVVVAKAKSSITAQAVQKNVEKSNKVQVAQASPSAQATSSASSEDTTQSSENESLLAGSEKPFWDKTTINNALLVTAALVVLGVLLLPKRRNN